MTYRGQITLSLVARHAGAARARLDALTIQPPPFVVDALCAQIGVEIFFPEKGQSPQPAKAICRQCPVTAVCLDYAMRHGEVHGVWGNTSAIERKRLRRGAA